MHYLLRHMERLEHLEHLERLEHLEYVKHVNHVRIGQPTHLLIGESARSASRTRAQQSGSAECSSC